VIFYKFIVGEMTRRRVDQSVRILTASWFVQ